MTALPQNDSAVIVLPLQILSSPQKLTGTCFASEEFYSYMKYFYLLKKTALFILFISFIAGVAQNNNKYFLFTAGYRMPVVNSQIINSNHGLFTEAGIDLGHLIADNIKLGAFAGIGWRDHFWSTSFDKEFLNTYNNTFDHEYIGSISGIDSAIVHGSQNLFAQKSGRSNPLPGCNTNSFHNYSMYYGIVFGLRSIPFISYKIYTGSTRSNYLGQSGEILDNGHFTVLQLRRRMYGFEWMIQDFSFIVSNRSIFQHLGLSLYYEYMDFSGGSLYYNDGEIKRKNYMKHYLKKGFFNKYGSDHLAGIKFFYAL